MTAVSAGAARSRRLQHRAGRVVEHWSGARPGAAANSAPHTVPAAAAEDRADALPERRRAARHCRGTLNVAAAPTADLHAVEGAQRRIPRVLRDSRRHCGWPATLNHARSCGHVRSEIAPARHACSPLPPAADRIRHHPPLARRRAPAREAARPRPAALSDAELLAVLFGTGTRGQSAVELARGLLSRHRSLRELLSADRARCLASPGLGPARWCLLQAALELARRHYAEALRGGAVLNSPNTRARAHPRGCATAAVRGVLLPVPRQPPPPHRLR